MARTVHSNDYDIRCLIVRALLDAGVPREGIRHEITLDTSSSDGRADMVLAFDDRLVGIEIKSGKDTLVRLAEQGPRYAARFDRLVLVADVRHRAAIDLLTSGHFNCYGHLVYANRNDAGALELVSGRWSTVAATLAQTAGAASYRSRSVSPFSMLQLLWQKEVCRVIARNMTRHAGIDLGADSMPLRDIRKGVAAQLRQRVLNQWEVGFWRRFDALAEPVDLQASAA